MECLVRSAGALRSCGFCQVHGHLTYNLPMAPVVFHGKTVAPAVGPQRVNACGGSHRELYYFTANLAGSGRVVNSFVK